MRSEPSERIALFRPGALGDALLAFSALALLRRARPQARVTLVARRDVLPLALASGLADDARDYDDPAWAALFAAEPGDGTATEVVRGADVVAWLPDADGAVAANLRALGAARAVVAPGRPRPGPAEHLALALARSLAPLGVPSPTDLDGLRSTLPPLRAPEAAGRAAADVWRRLGLGVDRPAVALHPGSGGAAKRWPPESFAALAGAITAWGATPLLIAGPADDGPAGALRAARRVALPEVAGLEVAALAALLGCCRAYVGNDAGPTHLASLLGLPTLALFGPTDPATWAPIGPRVRVLRAPGGTMEGLGVAAVAAELRTLLGPSGDG